MLANSLGYSSSIDLFVCLFLVNLNIEKDIGVRFQQINMFVQQSSFIDIRFVSCSKVRISCIIRLSFFMAQIARLSLALAHAIKSESSVHLLIKEGNHRLIFDNWLLFGAKICATHTDIAVILKQHYSVVCRPFRKSLPWKHLRRIVCRIDEYHCR